MKKTDKIGIVLVNYNGASYQNDCIRSILNQTITNFEIIVVDSNSSDNSTELLEEFNEECRIHVIRNEENVGYAKGNNIGVDVATHMGCNYILLLNNDTELSCNMIEELAKYADETIVTVPKMYYFDNPNLLWCCGGVIDWRKGNSYHFGIKEKDIGQYNEIRNVTFCPTTAMLIHKDIFYRIGKEDEKYFMYFDDTDLCVRIIDLSYEIKYVPEAKLWHKVSSSSGGEASPLSVYYIARNQLYFLDKYKNKIGVLTRFKVFLKGLCKFLLCPIRRRSDRYIIKGWMDYKRGIMGRVDYSFRK